MIFLLPPHENNSYGLNTASSTNSNYAVSDPTEILFIDSNVADYQTLIDNLVEQTEIIILDGQRDGIVQITESLSQYQDLSAIHIVSHGNVGELSLGDSLLNQNTLSSYQDSLSRWADFMTETADILLYGCNVAGDADGQEFVDSLSQYTMADIIASTDLTGSAELGGDWDLEYVVGEIDTELAFNREVNHSYQYILNEFLPDLPIFENGTVFQTLPADVTLPGSGNAPVRVELDKFFGSPDLPPEAPTPVLFDPSIMGNSDFRIDYTPIDLSFIDTEFTPDAPLLTFPQAENQPFSLNFANGNFSFEPYSGYEYETARFNSLIFPFDASSLNFNATNFEFTSVSLNQIDPLDPDRDSITFRFTEGSFDFSSLTPRNSIAFDLNPKTYSFYNIEANQRVQVDDNFSFDATAVTFRSDSITFDFRPSTLNFDPSAFAANANLYDYKLNGEDFKAGVSVERFNASDYRALDYAFPGDELFNSRYYTNQGGTPGGMNPFADYIENGWRAGRNPNGLFNVNYYLEQNTDVRQNGGDPLTHYALFGGTEIFDTRDPNRLFDSSYYLANNPDVVDEGENPLLHFIQFGWKESRFDNPDGFNPNRNPSAFFDTSYYFDNNPDVREVSYELDSANALQHYLEFGRFGSVAIEERTPHPIFAADSQVSFTTFVDADSASFEILQNQINTNDYGVNIFRDVDGQVKISGVFGEGGGGGNGIGVTVVRAIAGLAVTIFTGGVFFLREAGEELGERVYEAAEDAGIFERITISPADGNVFTFPGETEGTIVVEEFPGGEAITIGDDGTIFSTPLEPITELSSPNVFPQRDRILETLLEGPFVFPEEIELPLGFLAIETNPFAAVDKNINIDQGFLRELKAAQQIGGFKVVEPGRPKEDLKVSNLNNPADRLKIDVVGANKELILVGGPSKANNLIKLETDLNRLKRIADSRGVKAQQIFTKGTPPEAINKAIEVLGVDNVLDISDVTDQEIDDLIRLPIIRDTINF